MSSQPRIWGLTDAHSPPDDRCPDVYFTKGYGSAAAEAEGGAWRMTHCGDDVLVPFLQRRIDERWSDGISPYGYAGIHVGPSRTRHDVERLWPQMVDCWREAGLISLFFRFSPLDSRSTEFARDLPGLNFTWRGENVVVSVGQGPDAVWKQLAGRARTAIRKAERSGLTAEVRHVDPADLGRSSSFRRLYEQTMARIGSSARYFFPDSYYRALLDGLGKNLLVAEVRDDVGAAVASALVMRHSELAHYHLAGSTLEGGRLGANNLLVWSILRWSADNGCRRVHLGGGISSRDDDKLLMFKRSFGGERAPFWTASLVINDDAYELLVKAAATRIGRPTSTLHASGWFPAYRFA
ncbi:GNAT family N-acetyltransferase [Micromonospora sp. ALFpr18c]|uniref:lipid II:glycine glycyltransferase FemX n=1 Tax=Micromonospora sp. ALFpr18c TaxID=1458665 RepID=UPI00124B9D0C|nr:GNAT family N-acetyltransferase [Micromonospora sp. ALFpr18c]KAB1940668.1 GNAT family N-acetyltransferase [Micromonospora sp. ALFpr18c]